MVTKICVHKTVFSTKSKIPTIGCWKKKIQSYFTVCQPIANVQSTDDKLVRMTIIIFNEPGRGAGFSYGHRQNRARPTKWANESRKTSGIMNVPSGIFVRRVALLRIVNNGRYRDHDSFCVWRSSHKMLWIIAESYGSPTALRAPLRISTIVKATSDLSDRGGKTNGRSVSKEKKKRFFLRRTRKSSSRMYRYTTHAVSSFDGRDKS